MLFIFSDRLLQVKEQSSPTSRQSDKNTTGSAWMNKALSANLRHKKGAYERWKQGQVTLEAQRDTKHAEM